MRARERAKESEANFGLWSVLAALRAVHTHTLYTLSLCVSHSYALTQRKRQIEWRQSDASQRESLARLVKQNIKK